MGKDLVRDRVVKKKCALIFGMKGKKKVCENEKTELAKTIIKQLQDSTLEGNKEVEEVIRLESFSEGGKRPMKVKMRSQMAVEEITTRKGKLADDTESKDIWIKRYMNLEEREKEKVLRNETKEKNEKRTEIEKNHLYSRVLDMRLKKWYLWKKEIMEEARN
ncbi:hypothetical protein E2C01_063170 [Portunus trituberculatus]|uniref:Uncharacterized protein n=1 Tax=Portunus trituberculatus TaxID=210409 RepID=A0A5B7HI89_PORTR|nr:hypothetical protein [Portunus trituberculatus]